MSIEDKFTAYLAQWHHQMMQDARHQRQRNNFDALVRELKDRGCLGTQDEITGDVFVFPQDSEQPIRISFLVALETPYTKLLEWVDERIAVSNDVMRQRIINSVEDYYAVYDHYPKRIGLHRARHKVFKQDILSFPKIPPLNLSMQSLEEIPSIAVDFRTVQIEWCAGPTVKWDRVYFPHPVLLTERLIDDLELAKLAEAKEMHTPCK